MSLTEKIKLTIEELKQTDIRGCITGSCLMDDVDFDQWIEIPDVDVYCYSHTDFIHAIDIVRHVLCFEFGINETEKSKRQEQKKYQWCIEGKINTGSYWSNLQTVKLYKDGLIINVSNKKYQNNIASIIIDFDQTCIMKGIDIPSGACLDLTTMWCDKGTSICNPLKNHNPDMWQTAQWLRQFDRVVKYYNRGINTVPVAQQYLDWIDECLEIGSLWDSEAATEQFQRYKEQFNEIRPKIADWIENKGV